MTKSCDSYYATVLFPFTWKIFSKSAQITFTVARMFSASQCRKNLIWCTCSNDNRRNFCRAWNVLELVSWEKPTTMAYSFLDGKNRNVYECVNQKFPWLLKVNYSSKRFVFICKETFYKCFRYICRKCIFDLFK